MFIKEEMELIKSWTRGLPVRLLVQVPKRHGVCKRSIELLCHFQSDRFFQFERQQVGHGSITLDFTGALPKARLCTDLVGVPFPILLFWHEYLSLISSNDGTSARLVLSSEIRETALKSSGANLDAERQIEELNRIIERQQATVVQVGRRIFDTAQLEGLDGSVADCIHAVNHLRLEEALGLEIVHQVVGVVGGGVAGAALSLTEEDILPPQLSGRGFARIELAEHVQLRCRRETQLLLEFRHQVDLIDAIEGIQALLGGDHVVAVEICPGLLELGEILDRLERALRAEQPLDLYPAQRRGDDAMAGLLRTGIGSKVRGLVGMAVRVAVEARCAAARLLRAAVLGLIVLLCRERRHQKAQTFDLLGRDDAVEQLVIVLDSDELALRDVAEVGTLIEVHRRREIRQEVIRDIVIDVEAREIASFLPFDLVDQELRKHEAAFRMLWMG